MYQIMKLEDELRELKKQVALGNGNAAIRDRIVAIEVLLDNIYYIDRQGVEKPTPFPHLGARAGLHIARRFYNPLYGPARRPPLSLQWAARVCDCNRFVTFCYYFVTLL